MGEVKDVQVPIATMDCDTSVGTIVDLKQE